MPDQMVMHAADTHEPAEVRKIELNDLREALRAGLDDFTAMPSHALFLAVIYPILGLFIAGMVFGQARLHLIFPLITGFALVGPFAAIGLYELSRRREQGLPVKAWDAFSVMRSPGFAALIHLGLMLLAIFLAWMFTAQAIYWLIFGDVQQTSLGSMLTAVLTTRAGWLLLILGTGAGFLFALLTLIISVTSFPMVVDRHVSAPEAVVTSIAAVRANPRVMAVWGLIVAVGLALGSIPFLFGLAFVIPVLGHATWHLYRRVVV